MTIDTACSSSLVAIHQAVLGLCGGEAQAACIAGANVMLGPENFIAEASLHMLSPTGKSRMWDANTDGYAWGEGVAAIILKTLSKALADGDEIEGIIRETGLNSDGRTKGITMPSSESQATLMRDTYRKSGLDPQDPLDRRQYFEAHGTGTQAGDPSEAKAICRSFFGDPEFERDDISMDDAPELVVGSIETVIGDTEGPAGVAGLLKAILSMQQGLIPPNQHLEVLNPSVAPYSLIDLLKVSGVEFHGIVGHSSGEIGAAYAAGRLTARDAILIAYYCGVHARFASGSNGSKGSMMAAGLDVEDAIDFCNQAYLKGRVFVAASNAPMSVTPSGDTQAIQEAKSDLDNRQKFARILMVDTAYHSHHMESCAEPYSKSLKNCRISAEPSNDLVLWVSSVYGSPGSPSTDELTGRYWRENMVQAVLFNEALELILTERGPFDAAIEVGPHPALEGPATQTMKSLLGNAIAYKGNLDSTKNDVLAFGDCLAFLSTLPVAASVNLEKYATTFIGSETLPAPRVVKGLPPYAWDHTQKHYRESCLARQYLNKTIFPHDLLSVRTPNDTAHGLGWRNVLKPNAVAGSRTTDLKCRSFSTQRRIASWHWKRQGL
ncbi:MAG: hypothetical protein Q9225_000479 [Loekoesia sp. 1 TL-2023]